MDILKKADERFAPVGISATFNRILGALDLRNKRVLDIGCGFGEYLVKFGPGSAGITTKDDEVRYGAARGIRIIKGNAEQIDRAPIAETFQAIWANNLLEHLLSPHAFLIKLKTISRDDTMLILGVPVIPPIASLMRIRKFRGSLATAHLNFFTRESLKLTVERAGWKVGEIRPFIFSNRFLDAAAGFVAPHLYVVARNDSAFRYHEKKLKEWRDEEYYSDIISITERGA